MCFPTISNILIVRKFDIVGNGLIVRALKQHRTLEQYQTTPMKSSPVVEFHGSTDKTTDVSASQSVSVVRPDGVNKRTGNGLIFHPMPTNLRALFRPHVIVDGQGRFPS